MSIIRLSSTNDGTVEEDELALQKFQSNLNNQGNKDDSKGRRRTRAFFMQAPKANDVTGSGGDIDQQQEGKHNNSSSSSATRSRHSLSSPYALNRQQQLQHQIAQHDNNSKQNFTDSSSTKQQPDSSSTENLTVTHFPKKQRASRKNTLTPMTSSSILNAASNLLKNQGEQSTSSIPSSSSSELKLSLDNNLITENITEFHNLPNQSPSSSSSSSERKRSLINLNVCFLNLSPPERDSYLERLNNEDEDDSSAESLTSPTTTVESSKHDDSFSLLKDEVKEDNPTEDVSLDNIESLDNSSSLLENTIEISSEETPLKEECNSQEENREIEIKEDHISISSDDQHLDMELSQDYSTENENQPLTETILDTITTEEPSNDKEVTQTIEKYEIDESSIVSETICNNQEKENIDQETIDETKPTESNVSETDTLDQNPKIDIQNSNEIDIIEQPSSDIIIESINETNKEISQESGEVNHEITETTVIDLSTFESEIIQEKANECAPTHEENSIVTSGEETISTDEIGSIRQEDVSDSEISVAVAEKEDESNKEEITSCEIEPVLFEKDQSQSNENNMEENSSQVCLIDPSLQTSMKDEPICIAKDSPHTQDQITNTEMEEIANEQVKPNNDDDIQEQVIEPQALIEIIAVSNISEPLDDTINNQDKEIRSDSGTSTEFNNQIPTITLSRDTTTEISAQHTEEPSPLTPNDEGMAKSELITPHNFEVTVNEISFPKKRSNQDCCNDLASVQEEQHPAKQEDLDNIPEKEQQQESSLDIVKSDAMNNNNFDMYQTPYEEPLDVLDRGSDDDENAEESSNKESVLEEYLLSKLNEEVGYDDLEKKVFASFEGDFSSYELAVREEIRFLSESIEKKSKDIQDSEPIFTTPQQERPNIDLNLLTPESPSFNLICEDFLFLNGSNKSRVSPRRLISHQRIDTLTIRNAIEEYDNQRLAYEKQRDFNTLNTFDIKIRKDILSEVYKIEERFEKEFDQRKKNIKELLEDQKREISDLWTKRIFEYDQLSVKILSDITERHKHEIVQQEEKLRVSFGRKKPNFSKNTLAERSLYNLIASSKQYERGLGMEEKITNLERRDIINFYHQQEQHVAKKLEFVASKQLQELSVTQQRMDRGRKEMEMHMEDDIKKVDNRSNILFKDMERKKAIVSTQLRTFKEKFKGPNSPIKKQVFLHSDDFEDPIQESSVNINACLEFFLMIPDKINHFFQSVDKKETEVERETCNVIRRLVDRIEGASQLSPKLSTGSKSPSIEKKLNTSLSPNAKSSSPLSLFKEVMPSSPSTSSDSITPKKSLTSPLKESPKKTPTKSPYSLEEVLRNKKKPTPKHNFSTLMQYSGSKTHIK